MKRIILTLALSLIAQPLYAQASVVAAKKAQLGITTNATPAQLLSLMKAVATEVHGGIYRKTSGTNCGGYSCDVICTSDKQGIDTLGDSEGQAIPQWSSTTIDPNNCEMITATPPPDNPPPDNPPPTNDDIKILLMQILQKLDAIQANQGVQTDAIKKSLDDIKAEFAKGIKIRF